MTGQHDFGQGDVCGKCNAQWGTPAAFAPCSDPFLRADNLRYNADYVGGLMHKRRMAEIPASEVQ